MKKSVLFVLFALISVAGFSQITGWNAKVGMNFSNYTGDLDLNAKVGFKLGGGFEYAFTDTWSLQPSLFLTSKGAKKDGNSINAMYLELPVMAAARFNVADNTNLVVNAEIQKAVAEDNSRRLFYFMIEKVISFIGYTIGMYSQFTIGFLLI